MFAMVSLIALKNENRDRNRDRRIWTAIEPKTERLSGVNCASVRPWPKSILSPATESHPLRTPPPSFGVAFFLVCPLENFRIEARSADVERVWQGVVKNI